MELKALLDRGDRTLVLDVRNPEEIAICRIAGSTVIPLPELPGRLSELDQGIPMVVHCKSGVRSTKAIALLQSAGFSQLKNLKGGILAWAQGDRPEPANVLTRAGGAGKTGTQIDPPSSPHTAL